MQHLALLAAVTYGGFLWWLFSVVPITRTKSVSWHIARTTQAIEVARWVALTMNVSILVWLFGWAAGALSLSWDFILILTIASICSIAAGWIPYKGERSRMELHNAFAWMYSVLVLVVNVMLFSRASSVLEFIILLGIAGYQGFVFFMMFSYKPSRNYFLYMQVGFMLLSPLALVAVSYL